MAHYGPRFGSTDKWGKPKRDWNAVAESRRIQKMLNKADRQNQKEGKK